jgi:hypothetical protein
MEKTLQELASLGINAPFPYETIDEKEEVELSIGIKDGALYITFLGSVSKMDWIHDLMFWVKPYKQMKSLFFVHAGFLKIYKIVRDKIHTYMHENIETFNKIIISGYSLGGAIATLCYEDVAYLLKNDSVFFSKPIELVSVTTGAPRVFSFIGSKVLKERCGNQVHIQYRNDGVPTVPPALFGYKRYGKVVHSGRRLPLNFLFPSFLYDHNMSHYLDFENTSVKDNAENNSLYEIATKTYKKIYVVLFLIILTIFIL